VYINVHIATKGAYPVLEILQKYFNYPQFHPLQEQIIADVLQKRDVLVLMPTGGGKSLCYQIPAIMSEGMAIVISPLISLMKDQVDRLNSRGIPAASINSAMDSSLIHKVKMNIKQNKIKILYCAPERIMIPDFLNFLQQVPVSLIAIDEAHCISEWGHDFRPEYRKLSVLKTYFPRIPFIALTSTAVPQVQKDIVSQLSLIDTRLYRASLDRKNLFYEIRNKNQSMYHELLRFIKNHSHDSGIIYCLSRKSVEETAKKLQKDNVLALPYHAGLTPEVRTENQGRFIRGDVRVIVATIAFGMGIDKSDIRYVIHCDMPKSVENYYQETGRAGRDGLRSECILFFSYADKVKCEYFIKKIEDEQYRKIATKKLDDIIRFCTARSCRRKTLLHYFGELSKENSCSMCDVCVSKEARTQATPRVVNSTSSLFSSDNSPNRTKGNIGPMEKTNDSDGKRNKPYSFHDIRALYPSAYARWTEKETQTLVEEYERGMSIAGISGLLGRKPGGIRARLQKLGLIED
jgi:ATP-dependent DNA helicase RecQ